VPTGRLVVLGEPGSGKTMLMVRLVLDLLARRARGGPVPVLASVASWNPSDEDLRGWLAAQLVTDHPALADPPPAGREEPTLAAALLASGLILPILDGLDEIPDKVRGPAVSRINDALRPGEHLVVTCRAEQYRNAVRPKRGAEVTLRVQRPFNCARWTPPWSGVTCAMTRAAQSPRLAGLLSSRYSVLRRQPVRR
jgi:predicted NACHT family NTPase